MRILFLGTGGATITPRPTCQCRVCSTARSKGIPYSRLGPAVFIHDINVLFDTPEEIAVEMERFGIKAVDHAFYTHWHPDHTGGRRIFEQLNVQLPSKDRGWAKKTTTVYLPPQVEEDFKNRIGLMDHFSHLVRMKQVALRRIEQGEIVQIGNVRIQCRQMANPSLYAYLLEEDGKRVLLALDDTFHWIPSKDMVGVDLAVLETGWFGKSPQGSLLISEDHPIARGEASFEEVLEMVRIINAKRTILTHIEELFGYSYDDLRELEAKYRDLNLSFAYDGLTVEV